MKIEITDRSPEFKGAMEQAILKALVTCGLKAEGYAKKNLTRNKSVDTGLLRNSITYAISGKEAAISEYKADKGEGEGEYSGEIGDKKETAVYIGTNVEYAGFVEVGTSRSKAKPYLKPAVANHQKEYREIIETELKSG